MPGARCVLCLAAALAALARPPSSSSSSSSAAAAVAAAAAAGPLVRCEPCDAGALLRCKPLPRDCAERVLEPGCGCCVTCALERGHACGVYTARCGAGLTCRQRPGERRPLQALLEGRGVCATRVVQEPRVHGQDGARSPTESGCANETASTTASPDVTVKGGPGRGPTDARTPLHSKLIKKDQSRKSHSYKVESLPGGTNMDVHNFSLENKRETEYGPCRREMESILNSLKISNVLNPRGFRIPNCDRKGFYKKKQCRPSKGRRRGYCWCVDKYGQPLPGYDGKDRDETQCHSPDSQ